MMQAPTLDVTDGTKSTVTLFEGILYRWHSLCDCNSLIAVRRVESYWVWGSLLFLTTRRRCPIASGFKKSETLCFSEVVDSLRIAKETRVMFRTVIFLFFLFLLSSCTETVKMVNPTTGQMADCSATGIWTGVRVTTQVQSCVAEYEKQGYVQADKLTPEQKAKFKITD